MKYRVIKRFKDLETGKIYEVGDMFEVSDSTEERIAFLASAENKLGAPVIREIKVRKKKKEE